MKHCHIDVETTGLWAGKHAITQLSGIIEIDGVVVDTFDLPMAPWDGALIDDKALEVTNKTLAEIKAYPRASVQFAKFLSILDKYVDKSNPADGYFFIAYNAPFDTEFVRAMFKREARNWKLYGTYFHNPAICSMVVAGLSLMKDVPHMENFKLGTVAKHLGVQVEGELHDALVDVKVSREIFKRCTEA
jgi:DNA polymerase-3 subunit epsilon